jgi:mediator of RNA polymerase II transcription subunit 12
MNAQFNNDPNQDLCAPLLDRLTSTLNTLLEESPESFIASKSWTQLRETLASNTDAVGVAYSQRLASIENRNQHLHHQCTNVDGTSSRTKLIACLDMAYQRPFCSELSKDCLAIAGLDPSLCLTIIDWATSFHRPGLAKIYIGARLLRLCGRRGMNVTEVTLNFVAAKSGSKSTCKASVYHLISELVRSGHFSISVYMQWLIARGGFRGVEDVAVDGPCATRLLAELPLANLPGDMERLRSTLLGRIHYSLEFEETSIDECWAVVQNTVPTLFGEASDAMAVSVIGNSPLSLSDQSRTVKAEIGWQLRHQVQQHVLNTPGGEHTTPSTAKSEGRISAMTSDELYQVHNILEQTDDIAMLADILKIVSTSQETHVLGAVADILNLHLEEFAAIGALMDLTGILIARQRALALLDRPDSLMLLASLCELLARIPGAENDHNQLSQELVRASRKAAMDACSPVSDHVAEVLQKSEGQFSDEVEQCLASGTSMDMATMEHIFQVLIERLEASWAKPSSGSDRYDVLLSRLRSFDAKNFDSLLVPWVVQTLQIHDRPSMSSMLDPLISTACLGFKEVLDIIKRTLLDNQRVKNIHYYEETLDLVLGTSSEARIMSFGDNCRLRTKRHQLQRSEHDTILSILRETLELTQTGSGGSTATFSSITAHHGSRLTNLLLTYCLTRPESVDNVLVIPLTKSGTTTCYRQLNALLQSILGNKNSPNVTLDTSPASQASEILSTASDFTLPICKLAMRCVMLYHAQSTAVEAEEGEVADPGENDLFVAFETAVEHALQRNDTTWVHIVRDLGPEVTYFLHERSETAFMALLPSLKGKATASGSQGAVESADKLLFIIRATEPSITNNKGAGETVHILERLLDFVQLADSPTGADVVTPWLPVILKYLSTYLRGLEGTKHVQEIRGRILLGLSSLLLLLQGKLGLGQFAQQTFDTMLMLVDDLSEEARHQCVAFLSAKARSGPHVSQPLAVATPPTSGFTSIPISPLPTTPSTPGVSSLAATAPTSAAADPALRYTFSFGSAKGRLREEERLLLIQKNGARLFQFKRWENLSEPTPQVGENDTALGLNLFAARKFN